MCLGSVLFSGSRTQPKVGTWHPSQFPLRPHLISMPPAHLLPTFLSSAARACFQNQADGPVSCREAVRDSRCSQARLILTHIAQRALPHPQPQIWPLEISQQHCVSWGVLPARTRLSSLCLGHTREVIPFSNVCKARLWPENWRQRWASSSPAPCGSTGCLLLA